MQRECFAWSRLAVPRFVRRQRERRRCDVLGSTARQMTLPYADAGSSSVVADSRVSSAMPMMRRQGIESAPSRTHCPIAPPGHSAVAIRRLMIAVCSAVSRSSDSVKPRPCTIRVPIAAKYPLVTARMNPPRLIVGATGDCPGTERRVERNHCVSGSPSAVDRRSRRQVPSPWSLATRRTVHRRVRRRREGFSRRETRRQRGTCRCRAERDERGRDFARTATRR